VPANPKCSCDHTLPLRKFVVSESCKVKRTPAMQLEEERKEVAMHEQIVQTTSERLASMRLRAAEAGEAAMQLLGHADEDVASNGVLAFLSAFQGGGLNSQHTAVEPAHERLLDALEHASAAPEEMSLDSLGEEVVIQVGHNDAAAAALVEQLYARLHTLGASRRHAILRSLGRAAQGPSVRVRNRERDLFVWDAR
jgi:hypothetical protein